MIKRMRSRLAVKVFLITFLLVAACCGATYLCIAHFAPYIYTHDRAEAEELRGHAGGHPGGTPR